MLSSSDDDLLFKNTCSSPLHSNQSVVDTVTAKSNAKAAEKNEAIFEVFYEKMSSLLNPTIATGKNGRFEKLIFTFLERGERDGVIQYATLASYIVYSGILVDAPPPCTAYGGRERKSCVSKRRSRDILYKCVRLFRFSTLKTKHNIKNYFKDHTLGNFEFP